MIESIENWRWLLYLMLVAAALSDLRSFTIPNVIPIGTALATALILFISKAPPSDYSTAAASGLIGLCVGYAFYSFGLMGAGDGKLFAAAATWFATEALLGVGFLVSLAGVCVALVMLAVRTLRNMSAPDPAAGGVKAALKTPIPYGVAIAIGYIAAAQLPIAG